MHMGGDKCVTRGFGCINVLTALLLCPGWYACGNKYIAAAVIGIAMPV